jgi:hypothetical protein
MASKLQRGMGIVIALLILMGIPWPGLFGALRVTHGGSGQEILSFPYFQRHPFKISYLHSVYMAPTEERFEVKGNSISLLETATSSWAVIEYYGSSGDIRKEKDQIQFQGHRFQEPRMRLAVGFVGKQKFTWGEATYLLAELVPPGEILIMEAVSVSAGMYLWEHLRSGRWKKAGSSPPLRSFPGISFDSQHLG